VPNRPPVITSSPSLNGTVGVLYGYNVTAEDPNLDSINYSLVKKPDGMQIDPSTGQIAWIPYAAGSFFVTVMASDGKDKAYQNFTIEIQLTFINRPPVFKSRPVTTATVDVEYLCKITALDDDFDVLIYSLESSPSGMLINATIGKLTWTPVADGNFTVVIKVSDGKGGEARQEFVIVVSPAVRPQVFLTSPETGKTLKETVTITGTVTKGTREVVRVQMRIDGGEWKDAVGNYSWGYILNTKSLKNGKHAFEFRAYDGKEYSGVVKQDFKVDNTAAAGKGFIPMFDGVMALALVAAIGLLICRRRMPVSEKGG